MAEAVYLMCALTSVAIAVLLCRGYAKTKARFLLWCALCFVAMAVNNGLLFVDKVVYPDVDLAFAGISMPVWRGLVAMAGIGLLLWGLIWDVE